MVFEQDLNATYFSILVVLLKYLPIKVEINQIKHFVIFLEVSKFHVLHHAGQ